MAFDWPRMHKHEEQIENDIFDRVLEQITEHYGVEDIKDITEAQWDEINKWQEENVGDYSPMNLGFTDVYNHWEMENE